jgi:putative FmdB family regulatory protein
MKPVDYKCKKCEKIIEIWIKDYEKFSKYIKCPICNGKAKRKFSAAYTICHQGKCGNSKNRYTSNSTKVKKT